MEKSYDELKAENDYLRKKLKEEYDFQDWLQQHRTNGQCGGYIVMGVKEVQDRAIRDNALQTQKAIMKLINNPALSETVKETLAAAHRLIDSQMLWRREYLKLQEKEKK